MKTRNIIDGLELLERYRDEPNGYDTGADHDVLYAYSTNQPLSATDVARMIELGWVQDSYEGDEFTASDYQSDESWWAYV